MSTPYKVNDEFDNLLLSAVRSGDVDALETYLSSTPNPHEYINRIYEDSDEQKYTLLMLACLNEDKNLVHMLLRTFQADTEILNDIKIRIKDQNAKLYENVTVLWAVAASNNFELVKLLIEYGSQINHTTKTKSTPLRCACFHGNLSMVYYLIDNGANIHISKERNDTNLILCVFRQHIDLVKYLLDELSCDINECDDEGRSSLYLAVDRGSLELVKLLLNRGARNFPATYDKMSPVMLAAEKRRDDLVDLILPYCTLIEQIEAKELLGTSFACIEHGNCDLEKSYEYFSTALELRSIHQLPKVLQEVTHEVFNHRQECQTIDQLKVFQTNLDHLYIEAFLIRERLLGPSNVKYRNSILYRGACLVNTSEYLQGLSLWIYELELHQQWSVSISSKQLRYFIKTFASILTKYSSIPIHYLCKLMRIILHTLEQNTNEFDDNLYNLLFLITLISQMLTKMEIGDNDCRMFYQLIRSIMQHRYVTKHDGSSLLHLCLNDQTSSSSSSIDRICKYPCLLTTRLLLQYGADVNAGNAIGNTPVHVFASNRNHCNESILALLCNVGAHLDYTNALQERPIDMVLNTHTKQVLKTKIQLSLKCLCARLIQRTEIPYEEKLVNSLVAFIKRH